MEYKNIESAKFMERPNRFIAYVEIDGEKKICHVKNTGRCKELLIPGVNVWVQHIKSPLRKTEYDLICVEKDGEFINIDSQSPNKIFRQWAENSGYFGNGATIRSEVKFKNSRFDFCIEKDGKKTFVEVKGVTLKEGEAALFPDAPTDRGVKHLRELISCIKDGHGAYVFFIIQMKGVSYLSPNKITHPEFATALSDAIDAGVKIFALDCKVTPESIEADNFVEIKA